MYEFELNFGASRIHMRKEEDPNDSKYVWDSISHNHAGFELHVLLRGSAMVDVHGRNVRLPEHHAMLIAPGRYHCPTPDKGGVERFSFSFSVTEGTLMRQLLDAVGDCAVFPTTQELLQICRDIFREFSQKNTYAQLILHSHLVRLLVCIFRTLNVTCEAADETGHCREVKLTHRIDSYFEEHMGGSVYVEDLAEYLFLSKSQLNRLLKEYYGMTFREKLLKTRMDRASWLLRYTDKQVDEVAEAVGYRSESAFYQVFRKEFDMTPERYRFLKKTEQEE